MSEKEPSGTESGTAEELSEEALSDASGGAGPAVEEAGIVSPRDPASGLPTGQRMHKPFVIT
jgi:hypothetical protein